MAFVFTEERKINALPSKGLFSTPISYYSDKNQVYQPQCAPFRSSSPRKTQFGSTQEGSPGPGSYSIGQDMAKPFLITVVNNDSIFVKITSEGSSSFLSNVKRFQEPKSFSSSSLPIQQLFAEDSEKKKKKKVQKPRKAMVKAPIQRHLPSIPSKIRGLIKETSQTNSVILEKYLGPGPGEYQTNEKRHVNSKGTIWSKDKIERFVAADSSGIGPGTYQVQTDQRSKQTKHSPPFKSSTVRTFFDKLIYGNPNQEVILQRQRKRIQLVEGGPGQYDVNKSTLKLKPPKSMRNISFQSSIQRFPHSSRLSPTPLPYYQNTDPNQHKSFNQKQLPFNSLASKQTLFQQNKKKQVPGPAYYDANHPKMKREKSIASFGLTEQRVIQRSDKVQNVGPGSYNILKVESRLSDMDAQSSVFKSKTKKIPFMVPSISTSIAHYDLSYHNISTKMEKQKAYIQNLKNIYIQKAPFDTNHTRFPHYQYNNTTLSNPTSPEPLKKQQPGITISTIYQRKTGIGCAIGKERRFMSQRKGGGIPGVGQYESGNEYTKGFNIRFL